jgi:hypothetical protein
MAATENGVKDGEIQCEFYSYNYSLCSLMTRYMFAVRGDPQAGAAHLKIKDVEIDIHHAFDQLTEHFLCDVNASGQVHYIS